MSSIKNLFSFTSSFFIFMLIFSCVSLFGNLQVSPPSGSVFSMEFKSIQDIPYFFNREIDHSYIYPAVIEFQHQLQFEISYEQVLDKELLFSFAISYFSKRNTFEELSAWGDIHTGLEVFSFKQFFFYPKVEVELPTGNLRSLSSISLSGGDGRFRLWWSGNFKIPFNNFFTVGIATTYLQIFKNIYDRKFDTYQQYKIGPGWEMVLKIDTFLPYQLTLEPCAGISYLSPNTLRAGVIYDTEVFSYKFGAGLSRNFLSDFNCAVNALMTVFPEIHHVSYVGGVRLSYHFQ